MFIIEGKDVRHPGERSIRRVGPRRSGPKTLDGETSRQTFEDFLRTKIEF